MKTVCRLNECTGCGCCINICNKNAIEIIDDFSELNAVIDAAKCINCGKCHDLCPNNKIIIGKEATLCYEGWSSKYRYSGSSGGIASAIVDGFINSGGVAYSCYNRGYSFIFEKVNIAEMNKYSGSKYVKSNPTSIYKEINQDLKEGKRVLFVGLPCQVAGLKNYLGEKVDNNFYSVDLICHGTPSKKMFEYCVREKCKPLSENEKIIFRDSNGYRLALEKGRIDYFTKAYLSGLIYTENCYQCPYAKPERISDITLGDNWGTTRGTEAIASRNLEA